MLSFSTLKLSGKRLPTEGILNTDVICSSGNLLIFWKVEKYAEKKSLLYLPCYYTFF